MTKKQAARMMRSVCVCVCLCTWFQGKPTGPLPTCRVRFDSGFEAYLEAFFFKQIEALFLRRHVLAQQLGKCVSFFWGDPEKRKVHLVGLRNMDQKGRAKGVEGRAALGELARVPGAMAIRKPRSMRASVKKKVRF